MVRLRLGGSGSGGRRRRRPTRLVVLSVLTIHLSRTVLGSSFGSSGGTSVGRFGGADRPATADGAMVVRQTLERIQRAREESYKYSSYAAQSSQKPGGVAAPRKAPVSGAPSGDVVKVE